MQPINLRHLHSFIRVAELGSFSKAAIIMRCSQSALSRNVRALEVDLRQTLLARNGRGVSLTEAGRRLVARGTTIFNVVAHIREDVDHPPAQLVGRVVVGLPPSLSREITLPLVDVFKKHLPGAQLAVVEGLSSHLAEWIQGGRVDVGLLFNPQPQPRIETQPILTEALGLVSLSARGRRTAKGLQEINISDLPAFPLVMPEPAHVIRNLVETQSVLHGVKLNVRWEVSSVTSIIDLVCAGYGHAILTASAVHASGRGDQLTVRKIVNPTIDTTLCSSVSTNKRTSALTKRLLHLLPDLVLKRTSRG